MKDIYQVIKKVRISEKATMLQETTGELVLEVDRDANKSKSKGCRSRFRQEGRFRAHRQL